MVDIAAYIVGTPSNTVTPSRCTISSALPASKRGSIVRQPPTAIVAFRPQVWPNAWNVSQSMRVGGDEMDESIVNHIKKEYKLLVGQQTAEEIKLEIGSAYRLKEELQAEVRGRDMMTGLPKTVIISSEEIRRALDEPVALIIDAMKSTLDKTPPELAADIMDRGVVLAGGGALLQGLDERVRHETQIPVHLAESPLTCVAVGSGRSLEEFEVIHRTNRSRAARRNGLLRA